MVCFIFNIHFNQPFKAFAMKKSEPSSFTRRQFIRTSAAGAASVLILPSTGFKPGTSRKPVKRLLGRTGFEATTFGLGGQASIQWTPEGIKPAEIIVKAYRKGVNYFDTSNLYARSQEHYGEAFRMLGLVPGLPNYSEKARRSIFLTTKTHLRWGKGDDTIEGVSNWTGGPQGSHTADDIRRSLTQIFGDGKGYYPPDAWLDMVLIHSLTTIQEVDALYTGYDNPDPKAERIGALAVLRDFRDGTNRTGLNPKEEKLIRHIGFSGHYNPAVMMEMIRRDKENLLDAMLVAINPNDKLMFNMQYNVIPVAKAKNMGIIAMKVFADGAMYTKPAHWTQGPHEVVRFARNRELNPSSLILYALTTPGVHTAIIGIGQISDNPEECQIEQNMASAQIAPDGLSESDRMEIEKMTARVKDGKTNYFQMEYNGLTPPSSFSVEQENRDGKRLVRVKWNTAYAGDAPIASYELWRDGQKALQIPFVPQITNDPFVMEEYLQDREPHKYFMKTVDARGREASCDVTVLEGMV